MMKRLFLILFLIYCASSDWIEIPPIDCSVCITQPGFKPKVFNILRSGYLQNEILEGETYCISNTLTAGRDVTNLKPQGNVVIKNGSAKFFSPNGTTIQNYFEVQKGATLTIDPSGEYEGIDNPWYDYLQDDYIVLNSCIVSTLIILLQCQR